MEVLKARLSLPMHVPWPCQLDGVAGCGLLMETPADGQVQRTAISVMILATEARGLCPRPSMSLWLANTCSHGLIMNILTGRIPIRFPSLETRPLLTAKFPAATGFRSRLDRKST